MKSKAHSKGTLSPSACLPAVVDGIKDFVVHPIYYKEKEPTLTCSNPGEAVYFFTTLLLHFYLMMEAD